MGTVSSIIDDCTGTVLLCYRREADVQGERLQPQVGSDGDNRWSSDLMPGLCLKVLGSIALEACHARQFATEMQQTCKHAALVRLNITLIVCSMPATVTALLNVCI